MERAQHGVSFYYVWIFCSAKVDRAEILDQLLRIHDLVSSEECRFRGGRRNLAMLEKLRRVQDTPAGFCFFRGTPEWPSSESTVFRSDFREPCLCNLIRVEFWGLRGWKGVNVASRVSRFGNSFPFE